MTYWTISDIDKSLDPIRSKVNDLRNTMREEARRAAEHAMSTFAGVIHPAEEFSDPDLSTPITSAQKTFEDLQASYQRGTVFDYQESGKAAPRAAEKMIQEVANIYRTRMSGLRNSMLTREAAQAGELQSHKMRLSEIERLLAELWRRAELKASDTAKKEIGLKQAFAEKNETSCLSIGCMGLLSCVGFTLASAVVTTVLSGENKLTGPGDWITVILVGPLGLLLLSVVPGWFLRNWIRTKGLEDTIEETREEGRKECLRIADEAATATRRGQEFDRAALEREAATREEIRAMKANLEQSQSLCQHRLGLLLERLGKDGSLQAQLLGS